MKSQYPTERSSGIVDRTLDKINTREEEKEEEEEEEEEEEDEEEDT